MHSVTFELVGRRAFEEHRPYLVSIVAPAGVGKSRLLEEFLDRVSPGRARIALAQCLPCGQRLTYWPMRAILLSILELTEDAAPDALREALRDWLATAGGYRGLDDGRATGGDVRRIRERGRRPARAVCRLAPIHRAGRRAGTARPRHRGPALVE